MTQKSKLCDAYSKRLQTLNKEFFNKPDTGLLMFIEYLKYLRDIHLITSSNVYEDEAQKYCVASLVTAIAEFGAFTTSTEQKQFHWDNFMELTRQNLKDWITFNDTV